MPEDELDQKISLIKLPLDQKTFPYKRNKVIEYAEYTIFETLDYLQNLDNNTNYLLVTEYQIYNLILDRKDYSPVKYWHLNASYPSKNHPQRNT